MLDTTGSTDSQCLLGGGELVESVVVLPQAYRMRQRGWSMSLFQQS